MCSTLSASVFYIEESYVHDAYLEIKFDCLLAEFSAKLQPTLLNATVLEPVQSSHDHECIAVPMDNRTACDAQLASDLLLSEYIAVSRVFL